MAAMKSQDVGNNDFFAFFGKTTPYGKISKTLFQKFSSRHRSTYYVQISWNLADGKAVKSCVIYLTKKTKFHLALQLSLLRGSPPKSARASHRQCAHCSECSRFDPNWFTYGGDISERVNTVIARSKESNIRLKPSFEPNNYQQQF